MGEKKQHFTARISGSLVKKINEESKLRNTTVTAIVEEAFNKYFYDTIPGLCPECHTQNQPNAKYCSQCGLTLDSVKRENTIEELQTQITEMQRRINSLESMKIEQIGTSIRVIQDKKKRS